MRIGAHVSIQGGLPQAPRNARGAGCECFQIFTRSPRGGAAKPITPGISREFAETCAASGQGAWYIHTPYFVNLASADHQIRAMSGSIVREELERGHALAAAAVITHLGAAPDGGATAMRRVIDAVHRVLKRYRGDTRLLIEIAAGSGTIVGGSFEDLVAVVKATSGKCGVCLDTQHMFASGYDIRDPNTVRQSLDEFDAVVGIEHLKLVHVNDSKTPFGSRRDRHEHIGKGEIGLEGFRALLSEPRLQAVDFVLETRLEGVREDIAVLKSLRRAV